MCGAKTVRFKICHGTWAPHSLVYRCKLQHAFKEASGSGSRGRLFVKQQLIERVPASSCVSHGRLWCGCNSQLAWPLQIRLPAESAQLRTLPHSRRSAWHICHISVRFILRCDEPDDIVLRSWHCQLQKYFAALDRGLGHAAASDFPGPVDNQDLVANEFEQIGLDAPSTSWQYELARELADDKCAPTSAKRRSACDACCEHELAGTSLFSCLRLQCLFGCRSATPQRRVPSMQIDMKGSMAMKDSTAPCRLGSTLVTSGTSCDISQLPMASLWSPRCT